MNGWFEWAIIAAGFAAFALITMAGSFVSVWAIAKRKAWGRWLATGALLFPFFGGWYLEREVADPHWRAFTDFNIDFAYLMTMSMLVVPGAIVTALLFTGEHVGAYFAPIPDEDGRIKVPPPPPDFGS